VVHPIPSTFHQPAHCLAARIVNHLWSHWDKDEGGLRNSEIDLYNINVPMIQQLLSDEGLQIVWTTLWRNSYGRLFKALHSSEDVLKHGISAAGPDLPNVDPAHGEQPSIEALPQNVNDLVFKFAPDMRGLITPSPSSVPVGSDAWAISNGYVSVTPLRASFAEPPIRPEVDGERTWKIKL
jgi:tubulin--tyrosine ligase